MQLVISPALSSRAQVIDEPPRQPGSCNSSVQPKAPPWPEILRQMKFQNILAWQPVGRLRSAVASYQAHAAMRPLNVNRYLCMSHGPAFLWYSLSEALASYAGLPACAKLVQHPAGRPAASGRLYFKRT